MKFLKLEGKKNLFDVYLRLKKESHFAGKIIKANVNIFGENSFFFLPNKEVMLTAGELKEISDKMDKIKQP